MNRLRGMCAFGVVLTSVSVTFASETVITPDLARITDAKVWNLLNATVEAVKDGDKSVARVEPKINPAKPSNVGLAVVAALEFAEGTLEVDLKGRGKVERCFLGVAFNVVDGKNFEAVYFRPFNFLREPESFRTHSVQYVAWPDNTWEKLRKEKPGQFENTVKPVPDPAGWFHARVEVAKKKVRVWVDDAKEPCLTVDRLGSREKGKVGLWVDSREGLFSNLKIRPAI
jgi:hypothetical protein